MLDETLLDGVLVRTTEGGVDEVADIRMPRVNLELVAVFDGTANLIDVGEIDHGIDTLCVQIQCESSDVDVSGALSVAEHAALHSLRTGQDGQLGAGNARPAVVVRMHRQDHAVSSRKVVVHVLDLVCIDIRRRHLHGGRQIEDDRPLLRRVPQSRHCIADIEDVVGFGEIEDLGRELEAHVGKVAGKVENVGRARKYQ